ncbi:MAG: acetate--CoA ligase family protein, partial [Acidobacteriota bacterium]
MPETRPDRPLDPLFSPRSIAVIGASRRRDSIGYSLLHNLVANEFAGAIYPVNPLAKAIHSLRCYPTIGAIPDPIDLAVIVVPKEAVLGAVDECLKHGVKGLVVITAGFGETGAEGAERERLLREKVRAAGVRMIGPNCMGIINTEAKVSLNATFAPTPARVGSIGFVSQSGALGVAILNVASDLGIGLTQFASMGNKADVSGNDLIEHWEGDPETRVIAMYLESFGNPRRFAEIAKRVSRKKPILVVKSGRTAAGARAATSHTGAIAGADVTVSAILDQCGVLRADTIEQLFDVARALDACPLPEGNRVAILTNAGGPAIMATDACVNLGLEIAELAEGTKEHLRSFLPAEASVNNPVDMIASANAEKYGKSLAEMLDDPNVDMAIAINVTPLLTSPIDVLEAIDEAARTRKKPVLAVMMATEEFYESIKLRPGLPPVYRFPESAAGALQQLSRYAAWRRRPDEPLPEPFPADDAAVAALLARTGSGYLPPGDAFQVLELYGIPVARYEVATTREEALHAARRLGYPVVAKAIVADLIHKSEAGAIRLDLRDPLQLSDALTAMETRIRSDGGRIEGFLIQEMAGGGREIIFGLSSEPKVGPVLMFGLG